MSPLCGKKEEQIMDNNKLQVKDLINVGIFTAIYIVLFFVCSAMVLVPILILFTGGVAAIITGIPMMLFLTKVKKMGMVTIMGTILGLLMFSTGHGWPVLVMGIGCGFIADLIFKSGEYKSWGKTVVGYIVFSAWTIGASLNMWLLGESYIKQHVGDRFGDESLGALVSLTSNPWTLLITIGILIVGGIIGAYLGKASLKKHFQRAGIV